MDKIKIKGGNQLNGKIYISGAKNAALPLICASLLTKEQVTLTNMPILSDIKSLNALLLQLGTEIKESDNTSGKHESKTYTYKTEKFASLVAPYDYVRKMRASYYVLGPILTREGHVELSLPGGCAIGARPMDIHLNSLEQMGAHIEIKNGYVIADAPDGLRGANIIFPKASVGATCNILMAAVLAKGQTHIENAAKEPEIADLIDLLTAMGAKIEGKNTSILTIEGVKSLHGAEHSVIPDRIEAGTWITAALATKGDVTIKGAIRSHLGSFLDLLECAGCKFEYLKYDAIRVNASRLKMKPVEAVTLPYPGLPTDLQAQICALATQIDGISVITERIYPERFMHVPELSRMGANISREGPSAIICGKSRLSGAPVMASDLRASAALVIAALAAEGETKIRRIYHLDRGYDSMDKKLKSLGAKIERTPED